MKTPWRAGLHWLPPGLPPSRSEARSPRNYHCRHCRLSARIPRLANQPTSTFPGSEPTKSKQGTYLRASLIRPSILRGRPLKKLRDLSQTLEAAELPTVAPSIPTSRYRAVQSPALSLDLVPTFPLLLTFSLPSLVVSFSSPFRPSTPVASAKHRLIPSFLPLPPSFSWLHALPARRDCREAAIGRCH